MFPPSKLYSHVRDNPKCYDAYSPAAYNQVVHYSCYEDGCEFSKENPICPNYKTCQGCNYMFKFDKMERHLKDNSQCYDVYSPNVYNEVIESCKNIEGKKMEKTLKERYFRYKKDMDEWKQRFKTYNISEEDLENEPLYLRQQYRSVKMNWFSVKHLSKKFDEDYSDEDDIDQTERENDYRNEHENAASDDDDDDIDQTCIEMEGKNESSSTDDDDSSTDDDASTDDEDNLFQCKFCDEDFPTTSDREAHEKEFHQTFHLDGKTILESTDDEDLEEND